MFTVALPSAACTFLAGTPWVSLVLLSCARNLHLSPSWNRFKRERSSSTATQIHLSFTCISYRWLNQGLPDILMIYWISQCRCATHLHEDANHTWICLMLIYVATGKLNDVIWTVTKQISSWNLSFKCCLHNKILSATISSLFNQICTIPEDIHRSQDQTGIRSLSQLQMRF